MATPGIDDTLHEVVVHMRQQGQEVLHVWHFRNETAVDDMESRLLRALLECYLTQLLPQCSNLLTIERVTGMQVGPTLGPMYEIQPGEDDVAQGALSADALPTHDSIVANIHTTRAGRSGRGRKFIAGIPEGAAIGSLVSPTHAFWLAVLAWAACVATKFIHGNELSGPNTISVGVLAKTLKAPDSDGKRKAPWPDATFARATSIRPKNIVGTMNSRKYNRGS